MDIRTAQALVRFGLGRRGDEAPPSNPVNWLLSQLRDPDHSRFDPKPNSQDGLAAYRDDRKSPVPTGDSRALTLYKANAQAQLANALITPAPFRERLVWFWTNHFTISVRRGACLSVAAPFVEEAIRPHVTASFHDMLLAVMRHPAMLIYLDNVNSIGPESTVGKRIKRGLNENLARECLELHTVSPASGYTQADVTALANVLTGWTVSRQNDPMGYRFNKEIHEPGSKQVLGQTLPQGEEGGLRMLDFLAHHPSTHRFLATKLVRHFVDDNPPPDAVLRVEATLRDTKGNLGAAAASLVTLDAAWQPLRKVRAPQDYVLAAARGMSLQPDQATNLMGIAGRLGQPVWTAPAPNGWPDTAADWSTPEAILRRIDWAYGFANRIGTSDPVELGTAILGPLLKQTTYDAMARAGSRREAMTLLLTSPEFQRR